MDRQFCYIRYNKITDTVASLCGCMQGKQGSVVDSLVLACDCVPERRHAFCHGLTRVLHSQLRSGQRTAAQEARV